MYRTLAVSLLVVMWLGTIQPLPAQKKSFGETIAGWGDFVNPAGDCKVNADKGRVTITVPGVFHNLNPTPDYNNVLGPRLLKKADGDFTLEVQVPPFARPKANTSTSPGKIKHSYVAAGLLIWVDDKTFVRCFRSALGERDDVFVHVEAFQDGKVVNGRYFVTQKTRQIPDQAVFLRLERLATEINAFQSLDGTKWTSHARLTLSKLPSLVHVGVGVVNTTNVEFAPRFQDLKVIGK